MGEGSQASDRSLELYAQRLEEFKKKKDKYFRERVSEDIPEKDKIVVSVFLIACRCYNDYSRLRGTLPGLPEKDVAYLL